MDEESKRISTEKLRIRKGQRIHSKAKKKLLKEKGKVFGQPLGVRERVNRWAKEEKEKHPKGLSNAQKIKALQDYAGLVEKQSRRVDKIIAEGLKAFGHGSPAKAIARMLEDPLLAPLFVRYCMPIWISKGLGQKLSEDEKAVIRESPHGLPFHLVLEGIPLPPNAAPARRLNDLERTKRFAPGGGRAVVYEDGQAVNADGEKALPNVLSMDVEDGKVVADNNQWLKDLPLKNYVEDEELNRKKDGYADTLPPEELPEEAEETGSNY